MYEKKIKKFEVDWKSLIIKIIILLLVLCLIIWIISLFKKDNKKPSNIGENLTIMKEAAEEYFTISKLPTEVNGKTRITLDEMIKNKLVLEIKDQKGKTCNKKDSYAEATKLNDEDYSIKVKLVCGKDSDYIIDTISIPVNTETDNKPEEKPTEDPIVDNNENNNSTTTPSKPTTNNNSNNNNKKPSTNTNNNQNNNQNTETKPSETPATPTCQYGTTEHLAPDPLAFAIEGPCAVSKDDYYKAEYANKVSALGIAEYQKLTEEINALAKETGKSLYVEAPIYSGVYNIADVGLVGYKILMVAKVKETYTTRSIYEYYIDEFGNRTVIFDNRGSLKLNY